ncbi:MAG: undecaprenyl-diphosphate phosphatase [Proteobacteria bacterium]|jgi:undecaprenyl-diphosphatase|nr:undecaprenyl-diphosphate phosphatase [Pseudomonadota bacterium]
MFPIIDASSGLSALFLGVLQGLTEFLPVSSSGHLVLFQQFMDVGEEAILFDLVLHLGTLVPVLWFYRGELGGIGRDVLQRNGDKKFFEREGVWLLVAIVVASVPTAVIGLALEDIFEQLFSTPAVLAITFAITGVLLFTTRGRDTGEVKGTQFTLWVAFILGLAQGFAITPGISRSGTTIAVALLLGVEREHAVRFSFLMSVPAILGAVLFKARDVEVGSLDWMQMGVGGLAALVAGYFALVVLVKLVKRGGLSKFSWYCWGAAIVAGGIALFQFFDA